MTAKIGVVRQPGVDEGGVAELVRKRNGVKIRRVEPQLASARGQAPEDDAVEGIAGVGGLEKARSRSCCVAMTV